MKWSIEKEVVYNPREPIHQVTDGIQEFEVAGYVGALALRNQLNLMDRDWVKNIEAVLCATHQKPVELTVELALSLVGTLKEAIAANRTDLELANVLFHELGHMAINQHDIRSLPPEFPTGWRFHPAGPGYRVACTNTPVMWNDVSFTVCSSPDASCLVDLFNRVGGGEIMPYELFDVSGNRYPIEQTQNDNSPRRGFDVRCGSLLIKVIGSGPAEAIITILKKAQVYSERRGRRGESPTAGILPPAGKFKRGQPVYLNPLRNKLNNSTGVVSKIYGPADDTAFDYEVRYFCDGLPRYADFMEVELDETSSTTASK